MVGPIDGGNRPKPSCPCRPRSTPVSTEASARRRETLDPGNSPASRPGRIRGPACARPNSRSSFEIEGPGLNPGCEKAWAAWSCRMLEAAPPFARTPACRAIRSMLPLDESSLEGAGRDLARTYQDRPPATRPGVLRPRGLRNRRLPQVVGRPGSQSTSRRRGRGFCATQPCRLGHFLPRRTFWITGPVLRREERGLLPGTAGNARRDVHRAGIAFRRRGLPA